MCACIATDIQGIRFYHLQGHTKVVKYLVDHVTQFPSDADLTRYINTLSDKVCEEE